MQRYVQGILDTYMFTCMYRGRYTNKESQQPWVMAEPLLLSTAAQQEPRLQDRGLVGSRFTFLHSSALIDLLQHGTFCQTARACYQELHESVNEPADFQAGIVSQRVAKRSSPFGRFLHRLLCNVPKEGFCASAFCVLATF